MVCVIKVVIWAGKETTAINVIHISWDQAVLISDVLNSCFLKHIFQIYIFFILACENLTYGLDCREVCGNCLNLKQCNHINGSCMEGCDPGFQGEKCVRGTFTNLVFLHIYYKRTMFFSVWVRRMLVNVSSLSISYSLWCWVLWRKVSTRMQ